MKIAFFKFPLLQVFIESPVIVRSTNFSNVYPSVQFFFGFFEDFFRFESPLSFRCSFDLVETVLLSILFDQWVVGWVESVDFFEQIVINFVFDFLLPRIDSLNRFNVYKLVVALFLYQLSVVLGGHAFRWHQRLAQLFILFELHLTLLAVAFLIFFVILHLLARLDYILTDIAKNPIVFKVIFVIHSRSLIIILNFCLCFGFVDFTRI
mmetsp:Transcript_57844/g.125776  ORF Transcript_57844/g.125776 Transcript_57844/m.125776 type:complete len:208 (-) Transcript_57844:1241-1864(-)